MPQFISKYDRELYAVMRIIVGFLFIWHGSQKLFGYPPSPHGEVPAFITYVAGPLEFFGGLFIMLGLFTRWTGFICSGLMAAAYWMAHGTTAFLPAVNGGELAVIYCFVFLYIAAHGGGLWSVDEARGEG